MKCGVPSMEATTIKRKKFYCAQVRSEVLSNTSHRSLELIIDMGLALGGGHSIPLARLGQTEDITTVARRWSQSVTTRRDSKNILSPSSLAEETADQQRGPA